MFAAESHRRPRGGPPASGQRGFGAAPGPALFRPGSAAAISTGHDLGDRLVRIGHPVPLLPAAVPERHRAAATSSPPVTRRARRPAQAWSPGVQFKQHVGAPSAAERLRIFFCASGPRCSSTSTRTPALAQPGGDFRPGRAHAWSAIGMPIACHRCQPGRERARIMLHQDPEEPLDGPEQRPVDHLRPLPGPVGGGVLDAEPARLLEVHLQGRQLPAAQLDRIPDACTSILGA